MLRTTAAILGAATAVSLQALDCDNACTIRKMIDEAVSKGLGAAKVDAPIEGGAENDVQDGQVIDTDEGETHLTEGEIVAEGVQPEEDDEETNEGVAGEATNAEAPAVEGDVAEDNDVEAAAGEGDVAEDNDTEADVAKPAAGEGDVAEDNDVEADVAEPAAGEGSVAEDDDTEADIAEPAAGEGSVAEEGEDNLDGTVAGADIVPDSSSSMDVEEQQEEIIPDE